MAWTSRMGQIAAGVNGAIDRGVHRSATYIKDLAVQLAPEDSGDLKASGRVEPAAPNGSGKAQVIFGGGTVNYAAVVEYGRSDEPNYPAQPYLGPAIKEIKVGKEIRDELRALIRGRSR